MVDSVETAEVKLWGNSVGVVAWDTQRGYGRFQFSPAFPKLGLDVSPIHMPIQKVKQHHEIFSFPGLNRDTYKGLPGMLADALPDKFGNKIIDAWLARQGRNSASFSPIERLCYTGNRGMGALEFFPAVYTNHEQSTPVEIQHLVELAQAVTAERKGFAIDPSTTTTNAILDILRVGTSAGGARPKAIVAINNAGDIRSGQVQAPAGYDYWLLKFDGVTDLELGKPAYFGRIEYAYYFMALDCGIHMTECRLLAEQNRAHFLTRRFDRAGKQKLHLQSLCGLAHYDFNAAGAYGYEQVFAIMRQLRLPKVDAEQLFCRMIFNVIARNQDDHTKNIAFLMDTSGTWRLSPAYDVTYAHNPAGKWTNQHQMTINGKRDHFVLSDLVEIGRSIRLPNPETTIQHIADVINQWPAYAEKADLPAKVARDIYATFRLKII